MLNYNCKVIEYAAWKDETQPKQTLLSFCSFPYGLSKEQKEYKATHGPDMGDHAQIHNLGRRNVDLLCLGKGKESLEP